MEKFKKINNSKQNRLFWIIGGFLKVLDGLFQILTLGYYYSNFNINHLIKSRKNEN